MAPREPEPAADARAAGGLNPAAVNGVLECVHPSAAETSEPVSARGTRAAEPALVSRAKAGDMDAFAELYRANVGRVVALCRRLSGDEGLADELAQEAFVRAWRKLGTFDGRSAFSSWLHRLTANVVWSDRRSRRFRLRLVPMDEAPAVEAHGATDELALDLERAVSKLPARARWVYVLHEIEGYEHGEIARITGIAEGTSKAHLHRARQLLRKALLT